MLQNFQAAVKIRVVVVFVLVHLGLAIGIHASGRASATNGWDETSIGILLSVLCIYGGFLLGVFFLLAGLLPWVKRAQQVEHWTERLLRDLPLALEHLPKVIAAVQALRAAWSPSSAPGKDVATSSPRPSSAET